jgi:PTS system nitrogen regulatory IIA component
MNTLRDLILPQAVLSRVTAANKRQALETLTEALARAAGLDPKAALDAVLLRERLGGTGVGEGVAIPHAKAKGLVHCIGGFARLEPPIDFDSLDGRPADLVFLLLAPELESGEHLKALARVSRVMRRPDVRERLRGARSTEDMLAAMDLGLTHDAA